ECLHFERRRAVAAVHVAWQADENLLDFLFADQLPEPRQKSRELRGRYEFQWLCDGSGFITHRHADAFGSVIKGEDSHDTHSFATKVRRGEPISMESLLATDETQICCHAKDAKVAERAPQAGIFVEKRPAKFSSSVRSE